MKIDKQITKLTWQKVQAAKKYIQNKYSKAIQEQKNKEKQWKKIIQKMNCMNLTKFEKQQIKQQILTKQAEIHRKKRKCQTIDDYQLLNIIGRGSFGQVRLCRNKQTRQLVAIKRLKKQQMIIRNQVTHVNLQKQLLSMSETIYLVGFKCSFQDAIYLYLVMQYLPGGDFMSLLIQKDTFNEDEARFFTAELVLAVECVHRLGFIHRDIKPDNILLDKKGHIKLTDFGLSKYFGQNKFYKDNYVKNQLVLTNLGKIAKQIQKRGINRKKLFSKVGTPQYIAPQILSSQGYDQLIDFWSIGIILYESLFGYTPFSSDDPKIACKKILNWKYFFQIPQTPQISNEAKNLINGLICDKQKRMSIKKIKSHPFFRDINWKHLHLQEAPFIPKIKSVQDTSNFQNFQQKQPWFNQIDNKHKDFNFVSFNYKKLENESISRIAQQRISKIRKQRSTVKLCSQVMNKKENKSNEKLLNGSNHQNLQRMKMIDNKKNNRLILNNREYLVINKQNRISDGKEIVRLKTINF